MVICNTLFFEQTEKLTCSSNCKCTRKLNLVLLQCIRLSDVCMGAMSRISGQTNSEQFEYKFGIQIVKIRLFLSPKFRAVYCQLLYHHGSRMNRKVS